MIKALFFGSIGTVVETSELQRQAFNRAFVQSGLGWYWNVATYCQLLKIVGGKNRIQHHAMTPLDNDKVQEIHDAKEAFFAEMMAGGEQARPGVVELIAQAKQAGIPIYWVTTTSQANIDSVLNALRGQVERADFDHIFTVDDVTHAKPDPQIYQVALQYADVDAGEVLAVEDTLENQQAAEAAGLECLLFPGEYAQIIQGTPIHQLSIDLLGDASSVKAV